MVRTRPTSRLFIFSPAKRVLLFHYSFVGTSCWATPGGGVEEGESFEQAAIRELREETGIVREDVGDVIAQQCVPIRMPNGETVNADERFYRVMVDSEETDFSDWTAQEREVLKDHHWWSLDELKGSTETIFPVELLIEQMELL